MIVANAILEHVDEDDHLDALFGRAGVRVTMYESGPGPAVPYREPDGAWVARGGLRYRRVSGVLILDGLRPWNVHRAPICLYHHPDPAHPLGEQVLGAFPQAVVRESRLQRIHGNGLGGVFPFPTNWPYVSAAGS